MIAKIWKKRIIAKDQVFSECPEEYKESVKILLQQEVDNGIITQEIYEELINA